MRHPFVKWLTKIKLVDYDMGYTKLPALNHPWGMSIINQPFWESPSNRDQQWSTNHPRNLHSKKGGCGPFKRRWARLGVSVPDVEDCTGEIPSEIPDVVLETGDLIAAEIYRHFGTFLAVRARKVGGLPQRRKYSLQDGPLPHGLAARVEFPHNSPETVAMVSWLWLDESDEEDQQTKTCSLGRRIKTRILPSEEGGARSQRRAGIEVSSGPLWSHASWLSTNDHGDRRDQRKSHRQNESWPIHTSIWSAIHLSVNNECHQIVANNNCVC